MPLPDASQVFAPPNSPAVPIHLVRSPAEIERIETLTPAQRAWIAASGFKAGSAQHVLLPGASGEVEACIFSIKGDGQPSGDGAWLVGDLAAKLPAGTYRLEGLDDPKLLEAAAVSWGLGSYAFERYSKSKENAAGKPCLQLGDDALARRVKTIVESVWLGRDMITTPANDLGPAEIEAYVRALADRHGAECNAVVGDELLAQNYPLIHAVGRASTRPPRLIELSWGREGAPAVTLVGKGICFDTGGLDIKPASAMLMMKKDMGGSAVAVSLAAMIMGLGVDVRLRVLIAAAENSVAGNAFRPGDVLPSRAGLTVEIGNTDAEGRLVLADALARAGEDKPAVVATFATLTGAARVALGPDLPAMFSTDDAAAESVARQGLTAADPVWRMPFWPGYERNLDSSIADMNNVSDGPFAGAVTAALFLKRFAPSDATYMHFDLFGWRQARKPLGPKGGEPQVARAMLAYIESLVLRH
ncbi:MAG: leucyl aminopeptidase family protein [Hyphomicrobiaceae bacterium]|nr:leucyl aminopeptidase family protein [Hyphomicrobiaceae bacterium]